MHHSREIEVKFERQTVVGTVSYDANPAERGIRNGDGWMTPDFEAELVINDFCVTEFHTSDGVILRKGNEAWFEVLQDICWDHLDDLVRDLHPVEEPENRYAKAWEDD